MSKRCQSCRQPVGKQYLKVEGVFFHPSCFRCNGCQQPVSGEYLNKRGLIYHPGCYRQQPPLHCTLCGQRIEGQYTTDAQGHYHLSCFEREKRFPCDGCGQPLSGKYLQDIWDNRVHAHHGGQKTQQCHICARLISERTSQGGVQYADGRVVCGLCRISEITTPAEIERAKVEVLDLLHRTGFDYIPQYISVSLADRRMLNQRLGVSLRANSHGYTKTLERHINAENILLEHSIFMLYGLPRLMFHAVLAHELIHVWLNERRLHHWSPKEVEGFCNLGSALVYQQDHSPLARVLEQRLESDPDPVYGDGYRLMKKRLHKKGWAQLITEMQQISPLQSLNRFVDRFL